MKHRSIRGRAVQGLPMLAGLALFVAISQGAVAHHILGTPHYAYDEEYPQTPVLTYRVNLGGLDVKMTGYPGHPEPGQQWSLSVYILDAEGELFDDSVSLTVKRERWFGPNPVVYGPMNARLEEAVYKFYPRFDEEGNYQVELALTSDGTPWTIELPVMVGAPSSPVALLVGIAFGAGALAIVARAVSIKRRRREKLKPSAEAPA